MHTLRRLGRQGFCPWGARAHHQDRQISPKVIRLDAGLFLLKNALTPAEQTNLASYTLTTLGNRKDAGFWKTNAQGQRILNSQPEYRGRMYGAIEEFPSLLEYSARILSLVTGNDPTLPYEVPTHAIALLYQRLATPPPGGYIPWHRDNGQNDGEGDFPIVSFSVGETCEFLVCDSKPRVSKNGLAQPENLKQCIVFESGDAVVFGWEQRLVWHSVQNMYENTSPIPRLLNGQRLNLTCRYTPNLKGREGEFATLPAEELKKLQPGVNRFYRL